jgi:hypothetical protein
MSPEQTHLSGVDVDTSSDVYSLGILLYELLTGTTPLSPEELRQSAQDEVLRRIRETEPPRPSNRISSLGETSTQVSECRGTGPADLGRLVRGDLDWIVMKALEKDRNRRYKTADAFAADIGRHLANEPVEARPPSMGYRLSRFYRRNRVSMSVATGLAVFLFVAVPFTSIGWRLAWIEKKLSEERLDDLRTEFESNAIECAMNLDEDRMRKAIADARHAGASDGWTKLVEAIAALFSGEAMRANELLQQARLLDENGPSVDALEAWVKASSGDAQGWLESTITLKTQEPQNAQDKLFFALALGPVGDPRAVDWAQQSFDETKSPVAKLVLSQARAYQAGNTGNIGEAELARSEADAAMQFLAGTPYAINANLICNHLLYSLYREANQLDIARSFETDAKRFVGQLEAFPDFNMGNFHAALVLEDCGEVEEARQRYLNLLRVNSNFDRYTIAQFLYRQNEVDDALELLEGTTEDSFLFALKARLIAEDPARQAEAREMLSSWSQPWQAGEFPGAIPGLLCVIGYPNVAAEQAQRVLNLELADTEDPFLRNKYLLFAGQVKPEDLLASAGGSRTKECEAHHLIAQWALGHGCREYAINHLRQCVGAPWFSEYANARSLLTKLEDENWPHWLDREAEVNAIIEN